MIANGGNNEGLFRGAFMQSGSSLPVGGMELGQKDYDKLVANAGCNGTHDTLDCLRKAPYDKIKQAIDLSGDVFSRRVRTYCVQPGLN